MRMFLISILAVCLVVAGDAQSITELRSAVSYVAASTVYISAGREAGLAAGDTVRIFRNGERIGSVLITAVSKRSASASVITQTLQITAGDAAIIEKPVVLPAAPVVPAAVTPRQDTSVRGGVRLPVHTTEVPRTENIVSGRAGIQYIGALAEDPKLNLSQPSVLLRLNIQNLYGSGLVLSMYGRSYYDLSDIYSRYGGSQRLKHRLFDLSLQSNDPASAAGFGVGRLSSEFVGGMGTFDGGQFYLRQGLFTVGFLTGAKVQERGLQVDGEELKGALFVNMRTGPDILHQYNATLAYGRQMVRGNLDREFIYMQHFVMAGPELSIYESSEIELNDINGGVRERTFKLSNTFLSVNYYPLQWLSTNVGFDGSRSVYLFETMKSFSDTLLDKNIMQGYRAGATVRLPYFMTLSANLSYRTKKGDARDARTLSGAYRIADILGSEVGAGVRYADIIGVYSDGQNLTVDLDRTFFHTLAVSLRYDYYQFTILSLKQTYTTHTATVNSSYRFSRSLYSSLAVDGIFDNTMNSLRVYAEIGIRF
ncbi:MAG: hypothetical protein HUU02_16600 [Bacteroidetes bacterium]|nr:hypothetical protein [Bacteroidota bacterium]